MKSGDLVRFGPSAEASRPALILEIDTASHAAKVLLDGVVRWVPMSWLAR